VNIWCTMC